MDSFYETECEIWAGFAGQVRQLRVQEFLVHTINNHFEKYTTETRFSHVYSLLDGYHFLKLENEPRSSKIFNIWQHI